MAWSDDDRVTRDILLAWHELSAGDISILHAVLKKHGELVTLPGTPNCAMWENFVKLGWAEVVDVPLPGPGKVFGLTPKGRKLLPSFIRHYDLKPGTLYRPSEPTENFVACPSRWRLGLIALGAAAFVLAGLWMGGAFGDPPGSRRYPAVIVSSVGWLSVAFFGVCGAMALKKLFDTGAQLEIGPAGIRWPRWSEQTIPWSEVAKVQTWAFRNQKAIVLHLHNPAKFPGRGFAAMLASANRALTGGHISISLTGTNRSFDEAMSAIARFRH